MKIRAFLIAFTFFSALTAHAGEKIGNGGIGVVGEDRLYLLDLVEAGIEKHPDVLWDAPVPEFGQCTVAVNDADFNWEHVPCPEIQILTAKGKITRRIYDRPGLVALEWFQRASSKENGDLFGHKLDDCQNCYSENTTLTVALINKLNRPSEQLFDYSTTLPGTHRLMWDSWYKLTWLLVDAPLKLSHDENSSISDPVKVMMASRTGSVVRINSAAWSRGLEVDGKKVKPLDEANRVALIAHELLYFITESQGDTNSDRARRANARLWTPYEFRNGGDQPSFDDWLQTVPGHPRTDGKPAYYVHELAPGQEIDLLEDVESPHYAQGTMHLVAGHPTFIDDQEYPDFYPFKRANLELWTNGYSLPKTRLRISSVETHQIYGSHGWTRVYFDQKLNPPVKFMEVYGGVKRDVLPTIAELKDIMGTHMRLVE